MQFILPFIYLLLFLFLIGKMKFFRIEGLSKKQLYGLFLLKCAAGIIVWLVYTYYYRSSDMQLYFDGGKMLFDQVVHPNGLFVEPPGWLSSFDDEFFNNSKVLIGINFVLHFISFHNIFVHILFFCFIAFVGLMAIYKMFRRLVPEKNYALVTGIFLVPSALFWTAGIYKGTIVIFCIGLLVYITGLGLKKEYSKKEIILSAALFLALFFVKLYVAAALLPVLLINFLYSRSGSKKMWLSILLVFIPLILLVYSASMISDRTNIFRMIADRQAKAISESEGGTFLVNDRNFICVDYYDEDALVRQPDSSYRIRPGTDYLSWKLDNMQDTTFVTNSADPAAYRFLYAVSPSGTVLNIKRLEPEFFSVLKNTPAAVWNVISQPSLFGISNVMQMVAALENAWLLLLIILTVICFDKKSSRYKEVIVFCLVFALLQFAVIGLTTPAVGAMVRYKSTALPFLVTACLLCLDLSKLNRFRNSSREQDS
jgi:hypothetical protein